jgi:ATP-dependent protease Clp ATPase subunit
LDGIEFFSQERNNYYIKDFHSKKTLPTKSANHHYNNTFQRYFKQGYPKKRVNSMAQILILGGTGYTGKLIARYLLERSDVMFTIATCHKDKALIFENEINRHHV